MKDFTYVFLTLLLLLSLAPAASANLPGPQQDSPPVLTWPELVDQLRTRDSLVFDDLFGTFYHAMETDPDARENVAAGLRSLGQVADSLNEPLQQAHLDLAWGNYYGYFRDSEADMQEEIRRYHLANKVYEANGLPYYLISVRQLLVMTYISDPDSINLAEPIILKMLRDPPPGTDDSFLGMLYGQLLILHHRQGNYDQAMEYALKSNELTGDANDYTIKQNMGYIISIDYQHGNYAEVIATVDELERRFGDNQDPTLRFDYMGVYSDRGWSHYELGNKAEALADFKRSIEEVKRLSNGSRDERMAYYDLGAYYAMEGQDELAKPYLTAYNEDQLLRMGDPSIKALTHLRDIAVRQGDWQTAYQHERVLSAEQHVLDSTRLASLQAENLIKFEVEEREQVITDQNEAIVASRRQFWLVVAGLLAAVLLGLIFFLLARRLRRRNAENEQLVAEKETLIGEIHHRVKNNLQVISSLLQLQSRGLGQDNHQAKDALRESQGRVQAMGLIHQKLYQGTEMTTVNMPEYLEDLGDTLLDAYRLDERVEMYYDVEAVVLDVDTAIPLGLIVNELVTNSLKYAFPGQREGTIEIALQRREGGYRLLVADDGVGRGENERAVAVGGTGFGTDLVGLLTQKLKGEVRVLIERGYGTEILFPATMPRG